MDSSRQACTHDLGQLASQSYTEGLAVAPIALAPAVASVALQGDESGVDVFFVESNLCTGWL